MARLSRIVIPDVPHHVTQRGKRWSTVICAAPITPPQSADSDLMKSATSFTSSLLLVTYCVLYLAWTPGDASISVIARLSFSTTAAGVLGAAASAYHVDDTKSGTVSSTAGMSGKPGRRSLLATAINIGAEVVADSPADGYTLPSTAPGPLAADAASKKNLSYDPSALGLRQPPIAGVSAQHDEALAAAAGHRAFCTAEKTASLLAVGFLWVRQLVRGDEILGRGHCGLFESCALRLDVAWRDDVGETTERNRPQHPRATSC